MALDRKVHRDGNFDSITTSAGLKVPIYTTITASPTSPKGSLCYCNDTKTIYYSDGLEWFELSSGIALNLPPPLQSIANLLTTSGNMIYTTAPGVYAILNTSALGRGWLGLLTVNDQRTSLGLVIGTNVQAYSTILEDIIINSSSNDQLLVSNGAGYSLLPITTYGRSLLSLPDTNSLLSLLNAISGNISTLNSITTVSGTNEIQETNILIDSSNNISGLNDGTFSGDLSIGNNLIISGNLDGITPQERSQLTTLNSTIISSGNWSNLSSLNQNVSTTSTPSFLGLSSTNQKITNTLNPTNPQDVATKDYVDTIAASGAPPLASVTYATSSILPFIPVYSSISQTLTAGGAGALTVDGHSTSNADRILVKNEVDNRTNGIYIVTDNGLTPGPNYILTRSSDFNQVAMPKTAGTSVFVQIISGTTNGGTSWALGGTVVTVNPLTSPVILVQTGGSQQYIAGQGINSASLSGGSIAVQNSSRFIYSGNALELNTVTVPFGGTGLTTLTSGNVLIGNGTSSVDVSKSSPIGNFVGTTDSQSLSNKTISTSTFLSSTFTSPTNDIISRGLFSNSGGNVVSTYSSPDPTLGQILTATSSSTAVWAQPAIQNYDRELTVFQSASNTSPNYSTLSAAISQAIILTPTSSNWVNIIVHPGTYLEPIPIIIPPFISITASSVLSGDVIIRPSTAVASEMIRMMGDTRVNGITLDGNGTSTIGFRAELGSVGSIDSCNNCVVQNVTNSGFYVRGNGTQFSRIFVCRLSSVRCFSGAMNSGFSVSNGGVLSGLDFTATAFAGFGTLNYGCIIQDDFSIMDANVLSISFCNIGLKVGPGSSSLIQANYPRIRIVGVAISACFQIGLLLDVRSVVRISDFRIDEFILDVPIHVQINNPNTGNANLLAALWTNFRIDKFVINGNGGLINPQVLGSNLSEVPNETTINISGRLAVGLPGFGFRSIFGEGDFSTTDILAFSFDSSSGVSTNVTPSILAATAFNVFPSPPEINDAFYISGVASTGIFSSIRVSVSTSIITVNGVTSDIAWEYWNGSVWLPLELMVTTTSSPYTTKANVTFGSGDVVPSTGTVYSYRFNNTNWVSTLALAAGITLPIGVPSVLRYFIRARVIGTGLVTTIPQLRFVRLGTNILNVNSTGFSEGFGTGEKQRNIILPSNRFLATGVAGETAAGSQSLTFSTSGGIVRATVPNSIFNDSTTTTVAVEFPVPNDIDTSRGIDLYVRYCKNVGNNGNIAVQIDYSLIKIDGLIGNPNSGGVNGFTTTGVVILPTSVTSRTYTTQFIGNMSVVTLVPGTDSMWLKFYRFGSNVLDTYNSTIYLLDLEIRYYTWN